MEQTREKAGPVTGIEAPQTAQTAHTAPAPAGTVVSGRDLTKRFERGDVLAVDRATFDIEREEFISIVGPSGCGKSTLLRMVAGLIPKTSGTLQVHGSEITGPRADAAMMFQQPTLLPWKTARQNVLLPMKLAGRLDAGAKQHAGELLDMLGLEEFEEAYPQHLSGGMQQRVALARTLITGADLLLMDEPFAALDEFTRERLNLELLRIRKEVQATVLFVTHNINEAVFLADRVFVMTPRPGRLAGVIDVPLGQPRTIDEMRRPEFNETVFTVRELLGESI